MKHSIRACVAAVALGACASPVGEEEVAEEVEEEIQIVITSRNSESLTPSRTQHRYCVAGSCDVMVELDFEGGVATVLEMRAAGRSLGRVNLRSVLGERCHLKDLEEFATFESGRTLEGQATSWERVYTGLYSLAGDECESAGIHFHMSHGRPFRTFRH